MTTEELARDVLKMLELEQKYTRATGDVQRHSLLIEWKNLESIVRVVCEEIVGASPKPKKKTLFDQIEETDRG